MRSLLRGSLGLFLLLVMVLGTAWARPRIAISNAKALSAGNVGDTFLADSEGRKWFFKKDGPIDEIQHYGNFEAEMLVPRIFDRIGVLVPQVRIVDVEGREGAFMQGELVDAAFTGGGKPVPLKEWDGDLSKIDRTEVRLLQLVDVLIGNGDRHDGNLFVVEYPGKPSRVVPIDNNLALATPRVVLGYYNWHLTQGFDGVVPGHEPGDYAGLLYPNHAPNSGRPERITRRNVLYEAIWDDSLKSRGGLEDYARLADALARSLDDAFLDELAKTLAPDDVTGTDFQARMGEIISLLKRRRDRLPGFFRNMALDYTPKARTGMQWLERELPHGLFARLDLSVRQKEFLGTRMFDGNQFQPVDGYYYLRAAGIETLAAREVVLEIAKKQGLANPLKQLIQAERKNSGFGFAETLAKVYAGLPASKFQALHGAADPGPRFLEVQGLKDRLSVRDARGNAVPEGASRALAAPLKAAMKAAGFKAGEHLFLEFDAFAGPAFKAWVTGTDGKLRWRGGV